MRVDPVPYKVPFGEWLRVKLSNTRTFHHRILANFLKRRGWVVFYLEDRECRSVCWLDLYEQGEAKKRKGSK